MSTEVTMLVMHNIQTASKTFSAGMLDQMQFFIQRMVLKLLCFDADLFRMSIRQLILERLVM